MYLTYAEYAAWGGTMAEGAYPLAELKARKRIDAMTYGRVAGMVARGAEVPEEVKAAMMEIITVDATYGAGAQASAPVVASFNTDGYSESYGSAESRTAAVEKQLGAQVVTLLAGVVDDQGVPLMYAGLPAVGYPRVGGLIP